MLARIQPTGSRIDGREHHQQWNLQLNLTQQGHLI